jgi:hypothetical protein
MANDLFCQCVHLRLVLLIPQPSLVTSRLAGEYDCLQG